MISSYDIIFLKYSSNHDHKKRQIELKWSQNFKISSVKSGRKVINEFSNEINRKINVRIVAHARRDTRGNRVLSF